MKFKTICTALLIISLAACNSKKKKEAESGRPEIENVDEVDKRPAKDKKVTDRDYSITAANAYNNIFLDSMAMEKYITDRELADKKIATRIRSFYNARNYQYAWFSTTGLTEQARFFWNQYDYAVNHLNDTTLVNSDFYKNANKYMNQEKVKVSTNDDNILQTEFGLTEHFIRYINSTYEKGYVKRKEQEKFIPIKKLDPLAMADSLLNKKHKDDRYYEDVNDMYAALKKNLELYHTIAKAGGWSSIPSGKGSLKKNDSLPSIPFIKRRLQLTLDLLNTDTSAVFNDSLELAVKKFQARHGYKADGIITAQLVKDMNVPAIERLKQILLNMDRMRWMPQKPAGHLIIVNLPEFILHVMNGKEKVFDMVVVVGKVGNNTMMFNGDLNQIIFSPYWNVPQSIIKGEIEPAIARNPNYLANKNMERTAYGIRQKPGPGNALGKVKFIFPNSFNMYFHDTPSKSLFSQDKRAFSHGCVRLAEPQKMAEWLLRNDQTWPKEKIATAMNQTHETSVKLKEAIPVFIIYYTSWVDADGLLNFRDDVYQHDKELMEKMFASYSTPVTRLNNMTTAQEK
ncbi:MAG: L,D-transpeptidase family protein [Chitinophagaceae bacterium]|nr:L,D-transpeptidase family protein [Chitinophagaceae bacterium]